MRNIDFQSVRRAELVSAECVAAENKSTWRTGGRPMLQRPL
jgi:hypothetical protein